MRRPLLLLAVCFGAGCVFGSELSPTLAGWLLLGAASLILLSLLAERSWAGAIALAWAATALGASGAVAERLQHEAVPLVAWLGQGIAEPVHVTGIASADARERDGRSLLSLDLESIEREGAPEASSGRVRVTIGGEASVPELVQGERIALWTTLRPPRGFDNPGAPDPRLEARRGGWHASGYCKSGRLVTKAGHESGALALAGRVRAELRRRLVAFVPPGPEQAVVRAMVLGDRTGLERETEEAFRIAGTYHVLALSGAQVALVAALLLWPLRYLCTSPALQAGVASSLLGGYALLVGADVPVVRAVLMAVIVLVGRAVDLDADAANLLGGAGLLLLLARPGDSGDAGFQLSFAATLGLLLLTPKLIAWAPLLPLRLELALASSLAAQLALLPLLAFHFHRIAPAALVLNLLAVPLSTAVLVAGVALLLASTLAAWLATPLGVLAFGAARALLWSGTVVEGVRYLDARVATPAAGFVALYVVGLLWIASGRSPRAAWVLTGSTAVALVLGLPAPAPNGRLQLTVLDVGQGDCLAVRSPLGRTMLVDTGGSFDGRLEIGERVLGPYLWSQRTHALEVLLLTHAHPDHVGGAAFLVKNFAVAQVWEGLRPRRDRGYEALDQALRAASVPRRAVVRGDVFDWDGVRVAVLGPRGHSPPPFTQNDDSVVLKLTFGRVSLLLAGDVEASGEAGLVPGTAQVLKVAHHGSRTSSGAGFLAELRPRVALVSAGKANPFGHPHPEVIERLRQAGAWLLRTDRDGAIEVSTDGEAVWLETRTVGPARVQ